MVGDFHERAAHRSGRRLIPDPVRRVLLLLVPCRAEQLADPALQGGALLVVVTDRAGQIQESRAEVAEYLATPDVVLGLQDRLIDPLEALDKPLNCRGARRQAVARGDQVREFGPEVAEPLGVGDPLVLDLQDGDPLRAARAA